MAQEPVKDVLDEEDGKEIDDSGTEEGSVAQDSPAPAEDTGKADDLEVVIAGEAEDVITEDKVVEEAEEAAPDEDDAELLTYSEGVRKRIQRERAVTRRVREEAAAVISNERMARFASVMQTFELQENLADVLMVNFSEQIKTLSAELKLAKEGGETDKEIELSGKLDDLRARRREVEASKTNITAQKTATHQSIQRDLAAPKQPSPSTQAWLEKNSWFNHKSFKAETAYAKSLDNDLAKSGIPVATDAYFKELNKLISREMPELRGKIARSLRTGNKPGGSGVAPVNRVHQVGPLQAGAKRRVVLTPADMETMRTFKMDPTNREHQIAFARSKSGA